MNWISSPPEVEGLDPGFRHIAVGVILIAKTWNHVTPTQNDFLNRQRASREDLNPSHSGIGRPTAERTD